MPRERSQLVITVAGRHGSGRTTQAKLLAEAFGLRYVSAGTIFRERARELGVSLEEMNRLAASDPGFDNWLDARTREESRRRGVVIDANLSAWMAEDPDLTIFVNCPFHERVRRIAEREGRSLEEVEEETRRREELEEARYKEFYGVDLSDLSVYDVVLNTGLFTAQEAAYILKNVVEVYLRGV